MNENDEVAKKLGKRVCRLSGMLDQVKNTSKESNLNRDKVLVEINGLEACVIFSIQTALETH